jgi:uncharacterized protein YciI
MVGQDEVVPTLTPGRYLLLQYDYVPDVLERRGPFREVHLAHARAAQAAGTLLTVGAVGDPPTGALFVFVDGDAAALAAFAAADPYQEAGLVTGWRVQPWTVVM